MRFSLFTLTATIRNRIPIVRPPRRQASICVRSGQCVLPGRSVFHLSVQRIRAIRDYTSTRHSLSRWWALPGYLHTILAPLSQSRRGPTQAASVREADQLAPISRNRFIRGASIGPWEEDFLYNGLDWALRGSLLDERHRMPAGLMGGDSSNITARRTTSARSSSIRCQAARCRLSSANIEARAEARCQAG